MKILKWHLIHEDELKLYKQAWETHSRLVNYHWWFSGWKDLGIIFNWLLGLNTFGDVSNVRDNYAKARGTNEYGEPHQRKEG